MIEKRSGAGSLLIDWKAVCLKALTGLCVLAALSIGIGSGEVVIAAELRVANVFSDHMILQRNQAVAVWGTADPGEAITVEFAGQSVKGTADATGKWLVRLAPLTASSESRTLKVSAAKPGRGLELQDVVVGEIWLASGQSNMEWEMQMKEDSKADIPAANHPDIRLYAVPLTASMTPQADTNAKWERCTPESVTSFSAVGYYFGLRLKEEVKVPIGIIQSAWGGTRIEPWTTLEGYDAVPALAAEAASIRARMPGTDQYRDAQLQYIDAAEAWAKAAREALEKKSPVPPHPGQPETLQAGAGTPTALYNAMIHPLVPFGIRGAIWYQGESNHGEGMHYVERKHALLQSWRKAFQLPELPFYFVQIAPFQYGNEDPEVLARFWVAQRECMKLPQTGMAVITDIAEIPDIHPAHKKEVARRLALWALANDYGFKDIDPSGPLYAEHSVDGNQIRVRFSNAESGLASRDGKPLSDFEVAGEDGKFHKAVAEIDGNSVVVSCPDVPAPRHTRFGWSKLSMPNLMDKDGLPACSFSTN
ncbi:MAG: hypothetical protein JNL58_09260 [Planctomyces sp.]|nr:hypothetical protein [Planctomyces sp.]